MHIRRFKCTNLNSFLTYDLELFPDVSFLHGINGSGKTTILRAIASLLTPDPIWLSNTAYDEIEITIDHNNQEFTIRSLKQSSSVIEFRISGGIDLEDIINPDELRSAGKLTEDEFFHHPGAADDLGLRLRALTEKIKTFAFVNSLPTPIFLGLDRTTLTPAALPRPGSRLVTRSRTVHPYFRTQLDDAILEAERILARQLAIRSGERNRIFENLRNEFVLSLFRLPDPGATQGLPDLADDDDEVEVGKYNAIRASVISALQKINVGESQIAETAEPFLESSRGPLGRLPKPLKSTRRETQKALTIRSTSTLQIWARSGTSVHL